MSRPRSTAAAPRATIAAMAWSPASSLFRAAWRRRLRRWGAWLGVFALVAHTAVAGFHVPPALRAPAPAAGHVAATAPHHHHADPAAHTSGHGPAEAPAPEHRMPPCALCQSLAVDGDGLRPTMAALADLRTPRLAILVPADQALPPGLSQRAARARGPPSSA